LLCAAALQRTLMRVCPRAQDLALTNCVFVNAEDAAELPPYIEMAG
jgi:hypothetical protein